MNHWTKSISILWFSFKKPIITALGIVPIGVAIPPIEEAYAIESIRNFENSLSSEVLKLLSSMFFTIGSINKHVAVFDNHILKNAEDNIIIKIILLRVFPNSKSVFKAILLCN